MSNILATVLAGSNPSVGIALDVFNHGGYPLGYAGSVYVLTDPPLKALALAGFLSCHRYQIRSKNAWCKKNNGYKRDTAISPSCSDVQHPVRPTSFGVHVEPIMHDVPAVVGHVPARSPPMIMCMLAWNDWAFSVTFWKPTKSPTYPLIASSTNDFVMVTFAASVGRGTQYHSR